MICPCYKCEKHNETCHVGCDKWDKYHEYTEARKELIHKNKAAYMDGNDYQIESVERATGRKPRRG